MFCCRRESYLFLFQLCTSQCIPTGIVSALRVNCPAGTARRRMELVILCCLFFEDTHTHTHNKDTHTHTAVVKKTKRLQVSTRVCFPQWGGVIRESLKKVA